MWLKELYVRNFRIYNEARFTFCPSVNLIVGPNAQGKTSLLEAIFFLFARTSFRTSKLQELIQKGKEGFFLRAVFFKHGVEQILKIYYSNQEKRYSLNETNYKSFSSLFGILQGVVITPDDSNIVKGAPAFRRRFLDLELVQQDPMYVHSLFRFHRALSQRNILLKSKKLQGIDVWEAEMAKCASFVTLKRFELLQQLQKKGGEFHTWLTDSNHELRMTFHSQVSTDNNIHIMQQEYEQKWKKNRRREMEMGSTLFGPQREDFSLQIKGKDVRGYSSEGEQRGCTISLKMAAWNRLKQATEEEPLFLIDDVGMGLDQNRKNKLLESFSQLHQVFVTSTDQKMCIESVQKKIIEINETRCD